MNTGHSIEKAATPNEAAPPNRRPALRFGRTAFIGSWIRCQSPLPAAVGELGRWPAMRVSILITFVVLALVGCTQSSKPVITKPTPAQITEFIRNATITLPASAQSVGWREERGMDDALWSQLRIPRGDVQSLLDASPFRSSKFNTNDNALVFKFQDFLPTPPVRYRCAEQELPKARFLNIIIDESDATNAVVYLMWHET